MQSSCITMSFPQFRIARFVIQILPDWFPWARSHACKCSWKSRSRDTVCLKRIWIILLLTTSQTLGVNFHVQLLAQRQLNKPCTSVRKLSLFMALLAFTREDLHEHPVENVSGSSSSAATVLPLGQQVLLLEMTALGAYMGAPIWTVRCIVFQRVSGRNW